MSASNIHQETKITLGGGPGFVLYFLGGGGAELRLNVELSKIRHKIQKPQP